MKIRVQWRRIWAPQKISPSDNSLSSLSSFSSLRAMIISSSTGSPCSSPSFSSATSILHHSSNNTTCSFLYLPVFLATHSIFRFSTLVIYTFFGHLLIMCNGSSHLKPPVVKKGSRDDYEDILVDFPPIFKSSVSHPPVSIHVLSLDFIQNTRYFIWAFYWFY